MTRDEMEYEVTGHKPWFNAIDAEVAAECGCQKCGSKLVEYRGYQHGDSRLSFVVCNTCGECEDF